MHHVRAWLFKRAGRRFVWIQTSDIDPGKDRKYADTTSRAKIEKLNALTRRVMTEHGVAPLYF